MSKQIAESWFDAFRQKDVQHLEHLLAEDFVHYSPFGAVKSRKTYVDLVKANPVAFFSPEIEFLDMIVENNKSVVRYLVNGNPACDCIYTKDGLITEIFSYYHYGEKPTF